MIAIYILTIIVVAAITAIITTKITAIYIMKTVDEFMSDIMKTCVEKAVEIIEGYRSRS